jgi:hypothetical protein
MDKKNSTQLCFTSFQDAPMDYGEDKGGGTIKENQSLQT